MMLFFIFVIIVIVEDELVDLRDLYLVFDGV